MNSCLFCNKSLKRKSYKYCSNKCQKEFEHKQYIIDWQKGLLSGNRGIVAKNISQHIKRYLIDKFGEKCFCCGWNIKHPITGNVPLEIDHVNGNAEDTSEHNLRLICPNCHSLSLNFRNLNKGRGRIWRKEKYIKTQAELAE